MEQHPVPQNVTTFQFRLIGDMTIKQFAYLAGGLILAYICYKLPLPFFFTWPLTLTSVLAGFGLAFMPIEERPMDIWIMAFLKNIYSPTQYVWQKTAPNQGKSPILMSPDATLASPKTHAVIPGQDILTKMSPRSWQLPRRHNNPESQSPTVPDLMPTPSAPATATQVPQLASALGQVIHPKPFPPTSAQAVKPPPAVNPELYKLQQELQKSREEKEKIEQELKTLRQRWLPAESLAPALPYQAKPQPLSQQTSVRVVAPGSAIKAGFPRLTTVPNVISGLVKDSLGNLLSGILVTVRDKNDIPLRALKTNRLGQFAISLPLPDGTYLVEIEDPRGAHVFDKAQVSLVGTVVPAIEVAAKSKKQIDRAKLEKAIFGDQHI